MAFFDPVDPSTESLLWPGRVGFCIVAAPAAPPGLPLELAGGPERKPLVSADDVAGGS
jgi:hypothetical protein